MSLSVLKEVLGQLECAEPLEHGKVRIHPIRRRGGSSLRYLTAGEWGAGGPLEVEEVSAAGSVPEMRVRNAAEEVLFLPDGTTLVGCKQNRVLNVSILLAPRSVTDIPVSCVERGRWASVSPRAEAGAQCDLKLRGLMCEEATAGLKASKRVRVDQGKVWAHVDEVLHEAKAASPSAAYQAAYEGLRRELEEHEARLTWPEGASGVAVEIDGTLVAADLFDKPETLKKLWPRFLRGYTVSALAASQSPRERAEKPAGPLDFLRSAAACRAEAFPAPGCGTTLRLEGPEAVGAGLFSEDQLVHLALFAAHGAGKAARRVR